MTTYPKRTPLAAIRGFCIECQGGESPTVAECNDTSCPFHEYRHGKRPEAGEHRPLGAIKRYCHEYCQAGAGRAEVLNCQGDKPLAGGPGCPAFPFRLGVNPNRKPLSEERRAALVKAGEKSRFTPGQKPPFPAPESTQTV